MIKGKLNRKGFYKVSRSFLNNLIAASLTFLQVSLTPVKRYVLILCFNVGAGIKHFLQNVPTGCSISFIFILIINAIQ